MFWDLPPGTANTCKELEAPDDEGVEPRDYMPYSYMIMAQVSIINIFPASGSKSLPNNYIIVVTILMETSQSIYKVFHGFRITKQYY